MKKWLLEYLICPECLETVTPLALEMEQENNEDVLEGTLNCSSCNALYHIEEGVAVIVPKTTLPHVYGEAGYNSSAMLSAYLWSHYSEFFNGPDATDAYQRWASHFTAKKDRALDIGCSVGRLSFELSKTHSQVIGLDTSFPFIKKARELLRERQLKFEMIVEGHITQKRECRLNEAYQFDGIEFIVADAMALPFRAGFFDTAASVNILEKVPRPIQHLKEMDRVLNKKCAGLLFSDPFSWDESVSDPDLWLSGRNRGAFKGRGIDNISRLMEGDSGVFDPGFKIKEKGDVLWKIRKTQNLWEHITSQFIIGKRS